MATTINQNPQGVHITEPVASHEAIAATVKKRKFHPLWVVIPAGIALILGITIWLMTYFVAQNSPHTHAREQMQNPQVPNPNLATPPNNR